LSRIYWRPFLRSHLSFQNVLRSRNKRRLWVLGRRDRMSVRPRVFGMMDACMSFEWLELSMGIRWAYEGAA
jgi:hypothetical protein